MDDKTCSVLVGSYKLMKLCDRSAAKFAMRLVYNIMKVVMEGINTAVVRREVSMENLSNIFR